MSTLTFSQAAGLGVVQGLTEFLPVSSKTHLALLQTRFGLNPTAPHVLLFDLVVHVATLASIVVVFRGRLWRFLLRLGAELSGRRPDRRRYALRIALLVVVATIPTAIVGFSSKQFLERAFAQPKWMAVGLIVTGVALADTAFVPRGRRRWREFRLWQAALVGTAQAAALLPGVSRSGSTISAAIFCGVRRQWAVEFSFLIAFPAILGGMILKVKDVLVEPRDVVAGTPWGSMAIGFLFAFVVGMLALKLLLGFVRRAKLHYFAVYCWALAALILTGLI